MPEFLSEAWFGRVHQLVEKAGDLKLPDSIKSLKIGMNVVLADGSTKAVHLHAAQIVDGGAPDAAVTVTLPADLAKAVFIEIDQEAAMQGFVSGKMGVQGDLSKLMELQTLRPSAELRDLLDEISDMTD